MSGDDPAESTQGHKPETKATSRAGSRKRAAADDRDGPGTEGDDPETDVTGGEPEEESPRKPERTASTPKVEQPRGETKKTPLAAGKPKAVSLGDRMRFRRKIKSRR